LHFISEDAVSNRQMHEVNSRYYSIDQKLDFFFIPGAIELLERSAQELLAFRAALARVLASPWFLCGVEEPVRHPRRPRSGASGQRHSRMCRTGDLRTTSGRSGGRGPIP